MAACLTHQAASLELGEAQDLASILGWFEGNEPYGVALDAMRMSGRFAVTEGILIHNQTLRGLLAVKGARLFSLFGLTTEKERQEPRTLND